MSPENSAIDPHRILDIVVDPIFVHDREFRLLYVNRAYLECAGLSAAEALGRPYWEVFPKGAGPLESCVCAQALKEVNSERIPVADGRVFLSHATPVMGADARYLYSCHVLIEVTATDQANERIQRLSKLYRTISLGNQALVHADDEIALAQTMCDILTQHGGYRTAWVGLKGDDAEKTIHPAAAAGVDIGAIRRLGLTWEDNDLGRAPTGTCIRTGKIVRHTHLPEEVPAKALQLTLDLGVVESLSLPLAVNDKVIGALTVSATTHDQLAEEETRLIEEMAGDLAFGIGRLRANAERIGVLEKLEHSLDDAVTAIAATVEMRDPYTAGHQRRVAKLAAAIALEMGLSADRIEGLRIAGVVHDIGKIHVPAEILASPAKLTAAEFTIIKTHCQAGYDILCSIDFPWPVAEIVRQHHEKLDGSGYPNGLKGEAILLEARILSVADVIEAMASHRPYRPGFGIFPALQEISRNKGALYDPDVVQAALKLFLERGYEL